MKIEFEIPPDLKQDLEVLFENIGHSAKEAFVIQGYQDRRFGISVVRRLLGLESRWEAERWLADHDVDTSYSVEDLAEDRQTLHRVLGYDA